MSIRLAIASLLTLAAAPAQSTLNVPAAYPDIQTAIAAAVDGDTVQVAAGTYVENIDFLGKEITVVGAGPGVSILDGGQAGSVVSFVNGEGPGAILEGFTITNGDGTFTGGLGPGGIQVGGGLRLVGALGNLNLVTSPTIKSCLIQGNTAEWGGGVFAQYHVDLTMIDCVIDGNGPLATLPTAPGAGLYISHTSTVTLVNCGVTNNVPRGVVATFGSQVQATDCAVVGNGSSVNGIATSGAGLSVDGNPSFTTTTLTRCRVSGNTGTTGGGLRIYNTVLVLDDCVVHDNLASDAAALEFGLGTMTATNCTFVDNTTTSGTGAAVLTWTLQNAVPPRFTNCIIRNTSPNEVVAGTNAGPQVFQNCNVLGGVPGANNIDAPALFVDPANDDYHLRADSPCVDAGTALGGVSMTDIDGDPRIVYALPDIGADECTDFSLDPTAAGSVGAASGGPFDVLQVNGTSGGVLRRIPVGLGQPFTVGLLQPPGSATAARFLLCALAGEADFSTVTPLPFGLGASSFPMCPLFPGTPGLFTVANGFGPDPCGALVPVTTAPWVFAFPGIAAPFDISLQGVIEEAPGQVAVTNAVVVNVR